YEISQASEVSVERVVKLAREVWREIHDEGSLAREEAERAGIPLGALPESMERVLSLKASGAGFEPGSVVLVVTGMLLNGASRVALDVWKHVVLPRIREKWGDHALKLRKPARKTVARTKKAAARTARGVGRKKGR